MRLKRFLALALAGVMAASLVGCGGSEDGGKSDSGNKGGNDAAVVDPIGDDFKPEGKLVVWTLAKDLETFAAKYKEDFPGVDVEVTVIEPADYLTKVTTALDAEETEPDIIVGEPQHLKSLYDGGYFADLNQYGAQSYADKVVDYVWEVGQDEDGIQRAISYQITPAGFYFRRDIAKKVFGYDDPAKVGELFKDYNTIVETAETLKQAGYKIFASDAETNYFSGDEAWVVDGKLNLSQSRLDYMDLCVKLYNNDYTAFAAQWAAPWLQAMDGEVPLLTAEEANGLWDEDGNAILNIWDENQFGEATADREKTEVFAFGLPAWGVLTMRDNVDKTKGNWGVCSGPAYGFGGGTFIGISELSERKDLAWHFLRYCTLTESTMEWWITASEGDTVSYIPTLEKHKEDTNEVYGGQQLYKFWLEQAEGIDYSKVTEYDEIVGKAWGSAISKVKTGEATKEDAINAFYDEVASNYPDLIIER